MQALAFWPWGKYFSSLNPNLGGNFFDWYNFELTAKLQGYKEISYVLHFNSRIVNTFTFAL